MVLMILPNPQVTGILMLIIFLSLIPTAFIFYKLDKKKFKLLIKLILNK